MDALTPLKTATDQELIDEMKSRFRFFACVHDDKKDGIWYRYNIDCLKDAMMTLGMLDMLKENIIEDTRQNVEVE